MIDNINLNGKPAVMGFNNYDSNEADSLKLEFSEPVDYCDLFTFLLAASSGFDLLVI